MTLTGVTKIGELVLTGSYPILIAPHMSISGFCVKDKPSACCGFAKLLEAGAEVDEEIKASYLKYIKGQKKRLYPFAVQHEELLRLMLTEKMLVRKDVDLLLEECDKQENVTVKAAVLEYSGRNLKP